MQLHPSLLLAAALALTSTTSAQSNQDPNVNVLLADVDSLAMLGRTGAFPNGTNGLAVETVICNIGTISLPWMAVMNPNHPVIGFLVARQANGRFEQISDRSFVKHGFFAMGGSRCGTCTVPTGGQLGTMLGIGCSDIYDGATNGERFVLGPADEIDPWEATWAPRCSYFDAGDPAVAAPNNCDGKRSLSLAQANSLGPVAHRITVDDEDLNLPAAAYYAQAQYVVRGEPEANRADSIGSRGFNPNWNGSSWNFQRAGGVVYGSVLNRWVGASVTSGLNDSGAGADDGRVYVAVRVTGPVQGRYHYEYAVHNRDNRRGLGAFRIPVCAGARVFDVGCSDIDADPTNDWQATVGASEIEFSTLSDPQRWNTIYNFWFDSDAAPASSAVTFDAFDPGPGGPSFGFDAMTPTALYNLYLGEGCAATAGGELYAAGTPAHATLGNDTFALESTGNAPGMPNLLLSAFRASPSNVFGCTLWLSGFPLPISTTHADATGLASHALAVPASPSLEGLDVYFQSIGLNPGQGSILRLFDLSNGLRVRVGDTLPSCP